VPEPLDEGPDGFERVRIFLARARRQGEDFGTAWERALAALPRGFGGATLKALDGTRGEWEAAFNREPAPEPASRVEARRAAEVIAEVLARGSKPRR
jgi:hypothetical protein